jgi:four helix bundle protein
MPINHFTQLQCWQLADRLRGEVIALSAKPEITRDSRFCEDLLAAAGSVPRNISEGFTRFTDAEIVRFFRYALGSLAEVQDGLFECKTRKALDQPEFDRLWELAEHTRAKTIRFKNAHEKPQKRRPRTSRRRS